MDVVWGLVAAFGWGWSLFLSRLPMRSVGMIRATAVAESFSFLLLTVFMLNSGTLASLMHPNLADDWLYALIILAINGLANLLMFIAIDIGVMAIVVPITSAYAVFITLFDILDGAVLATGQYVGIALAIIGVVLITMPRRKSPIRHDQRGQILGMVAAVAASLLYGYSYWATGTHVVPVMGSITPIWIGRICTLMALAIYARWRWHRKAAYGQFNWRIGLLIMLYASLDMGAFIANNVGYTVGSVTIVSVLASLYSAITVILARIFYGEYLSRLQWSAVAMILIGVVLVNV
ncbi:MAG: DMT family transporter [Anaerolineae bacterium]|nr:DMT family transporter [Anaerolineae bacterium]